MNNVGGTDVEFTGLPKELVDQLTKRFARFVGIKIAAGAVLLVFTIAAVVLSNSPWAHPFWNLWEISLRLQV